VSYRKSFRADAEKRVDALVKRLGWTWPLRPQDAYSIGQRLGYAIGVDRARRVNVEYCIKRGDVARPTNHDADGQVLWTKAALLDLLLALEKYRKWLFGFHVGKKTWAELDAEVGKLDRAADRVDGRWFNSDPKQLLTELAGLDDAGEREDCYEFLVAKAPYIEDVPELDALIQIVLDEQDAAVRKAIAERIIKLGGLDLKARG